MSVRCAHSLQKMEQIGMVVRYFSTQGIEKFANVSFQMEKDPMFSRSMGRIGVDDQNLRRMGDGFQLISSINTTFAGVRSRVILESLTQFQCV